MLSTISLALVLLIPLSFSLQPQHGEQFKKIVRDGCPPPLLPSPDLPTVPTSFVTRLEVALQEEGRERAFNGIEMFDANSNRGVLDYEVGEGVHDTKPYLVAERMYYDVMADDVLVVTSEMSCTEEEGENCPNNEYCYAGKIEDMSSEIQELFGIIQVPGEHGFFGAAGILEFGSMFNYSLAMEVPCHGFKCQVYQTCLEKEDEDATALFTYAWSKDDWSMEGIKDRVPVYLELMTTGKFGGHTTKEVMMRFDFFDFQPYVTPSDFSLQPAATVYCANRSSQFPIPDFPPFYTMTSELEQLDEPRQGVDSNLTTLGDDLVEMILRTEEYFDSIVNISRQDRIGPGENQTARFVARLQTIYDFNMGLAFYVQPGLLKCEVKSIPNKFSWGTIHVGEDGLVSMVAPTDQEPLIQPFQYNGRHVIRGSEADVWVGIKKNDATLGVETHVWYYAPNNFLSNPEVERPSWDRTPLALVIGDYMSQEPPQYGQNFFNFVYKTPHSHRHDISLCYKINDMQHFAVDFPADTLNKTKYLREHLLYSVTRALAEAGQVSPLRINRPQLEESNKAVSVVFTVLQLQSVIGNSATQTIQADLSSAVASITKAVDEGRLDASVILPGHEFIEVVRAVAVPGTLREVRRNNGQVDGTLIYTGYSPGSMASLGIGMLILGAALVPAAYFQYNWWKSAM